MYSNQTIIITYHNHEKDEREPAIGVSLNYVIPCGSDVSLAPRRVFCQAYSRSLPR
jgi:hypothetical protein